MQLELDTKIESSYNEAHVPVPFLIGTRGWGLFVESPYPGAFAVATAAPDVVEATFGTGAASGQGLAFHLFAALQPLDVTKLYYDATAYPRLPAPWALGPWVWRDENKDQAQVEDDIAKIRSLDLATSALWIDRPYATAVQTFDFKKEQFPDPDGMIQKLHDYGLRTALWHAPYLDEKDPATQAAVADARARGYYPPGVGPLFNKWGTIVDLTNPAAYAWWQGQIRQYTDRGVEGFKLDYGEDIVPGVGKIRSSWRFADGSDERTMHSRFQLLYHRVYAETLPAAGGFLLCRHSTYGDQANVSVIWPGDLDASFARHREAVDDSGDRYNAVGGLPASVVAGLSLGPSGFPFFGADTGGYRHSPPDKELFVRWFEQTALSSVMQIGTSSNTVAWEKEGGPGFDDELLSLYRDYTRLHLRLFPYEWTLAQQIATTGRPIQRPLGLAYPDLGQHPSDEYLFGPDLLVAPVVDRGATSRSVIFPAGRWVDWFSGEVIAGGATQQVAAPLGKLPLYLRESGIVPLLRPTIDTLSPTTHPDEVDSYDTTPGVLFARIFPGPSSTFTLFDGTTLGQSLAGNLLTLVTKDGSAFSLGSHLEIVGLATPPASITLDGAALDAAASLAALDDGPGWFLEGTTLHLRVPPGQHKVTAGSP
jgi:alpha-D-xyloside xylohydrolase